MQKNMGSADRMIRVIIALLFVGLYYANVITGTLATILLIFAGVFVLTSMISFCPLYTLFGMRTTKQS